MKVSGIITDAETKEYLPYVVIFESDANGKLISGKNTTSDEQGNYSMEVADSNSNSPRYVTARIVGKKEQTKLLPPFGVVNFSLQPSTESTLQEVVVESTKSIKRNGKKIVGVGLILTGIFSLVKGLK